MNGAHLHLLVNHVSLFALLFGVVALAASMKRRSSELRVLATGLFVIAGVFAFVGFESGEAAADVLKAVGQQDLETLVNPHAQAAEWALRSGILVATLAVASEWAIRSKKSWARKLQWAVLFFALHGCTVFAATAYQGGLIMHAEIRGE